MKKIIKKKIVLTVILAVGIIFVPERISADQQQSLEMIIRRTLANNPEIRQAFHQWEAAKHKIKSAKSLDDPKASYGYFGEEVQTRVGPQEQKYGVSQNVPFPGKRRLKKKMQEKQAQAFEEQYRAIKNETIKEVKFVYYDLFWVDQALQVNEEEKALLEKLEEVAQRNYESNLIPQQDVIKAQVELSKIIKKLFMLRQNRESLVARLNNLMNTSLGIEIDKITSLPERSFELELQEVLDIAQDARQELLAAALNVKKAEYEKSLAKMAYLPDFTFGAEFIDIGGGTTSSVDDGQDAWMGMVTVNVPIWFGKLRAQVKERNSALLAAQENKESIKDQVTFQVQDLYYKIQAYKDIVLLYQTALLPQAEQAFDASQVGFETGKVSFLDWLDTERTFLQTRLAYYKSITDYHKTIAYLERVVGGQL